jgi:hypothetical protein
MLKEFIEYLTDQIGQPYVWGGQHTKLTPENYKEVIHKKEAGRGSYPDGETYEEATIKFCEKKFAEGATELYAYDCSGLGVYWIVNLNHLWPSDVNANTMMGRCVDLDTPEPPEKGWWVFRLDGKRASHIGYMIDNEYLIEVKGRKYGVVKTKWREKDWDCWGIPKIFEDEIRNPDPPDPPTPPDPPVPPEPPTPTKQMVYVIGRSVNVRDSDSKAGKIMFTAHKGNRFHLIDISPDTGWYHIETYKGPGYISNREDLTCLVTIS